MNRNSAINLFQVKIFQHHNHEMAFINMINVCSNKCYRNVKKTELYDVFNMFFNNSISWVGYVVNRRHFSSLNHHVLIKRLFSLWKLILVWRNKTSILILHVKHCSLHIKLKLKTAKESKITVKTTFKIVIYSVHT